MFFFFFFFKQKTAYEMRISDWSSDVCSSDLRLRQDRIIKGVAGIIDEVAVRIALHDGLTARDRRGGIGGVDLQSPRIDALVAQRRDQFAVAAADVQHARTSGTGVGDDRKIGRSEEHTSELQSLMRNPTACLC